MPFRKLSQFAVAGLTLLTLTPFVPHAQAGQFIDAPVYATGGTPSIALVADFNRDGRPDLLVASLVGRVSLLLGNGDGSFRPPLDVGPPVTSATVGDFNQDGNPDIAFSNATGGHITILLGNGNGTFRRGVTVNAERPSAIATADLNGDGKLDLAAVSPIPGSPAVNVLLGNGDGTFQAATLYPTATGPVGIQIADLNGDGKMDLVTIENTTLDGQVSILLGNGDGTFQSHVDDDIKFAPVAIAVADFNGDGKPDLAVTIPGYVSVLLGNGDGTFQTLVSFFTGRQPNAVVAADFNGDGKIDLATSNAPDYTVSALLGKGDGTFQTHIDYGAGVSPVSLVAGDFNLDHKPDLAVPDTGSAGQSKFISILIGNGDGTLQARRDFGSVVGVSVAASGDLNGDGLADLALGSEDGGLVSVLLARADGSFSASRFFNTPKATHALAVGDLNNDGKLDIVSGSDGMDNSDVSVLLGKGDGTFQAHIDTTITLHPAGIAVGDFNRDGNRDVAISGVLGNSGEVSVLLGNGDGTFQSPITYDVGGKAGTLAAGDVNGDGKIDLMCRRNTVVSALLGNGDGTFQAHLDSNVGGTAQSIALGDLNGDGILDLAVSDNAVGFMRGNGDGTFQPAVNYPAGSGPAAIVLGDFNHDGHLDAAVVNSNDFTVSSLLGNGDGTFQPHQDYSAGMNPMGIAAGDFNGDGFLDLGVANSGAVGIDDGYTVSVYLNKGSGGRAR